MHIDKLRTVAAMLIASAWFGTAGCSGPRATAPDGDPRAIEMHRTFLVRLHSLDSAAVEFAAAAQNLGADATSSHNAQRAFVRAREAYKRAELWIEAWLPIAAEQLNGPPVDEVDLGEGPTTIDPAHGFQVLEGMLFPLIDTARRSDIAREAHLLRDQASRTLAFAQHTTIRDEQVFDATRLELARIVSLGIVGFDSPVRHASLAEAVTSFAGIRDAVAPYRTDLRRVAPEIDARLENLLALTDTLLSIGDFAAFDRLGFIVRAANPLGRAIAAARDALGVSVPSEPRMWRATAPTLFESNAFSGAALCPLCAPSRARERVLLGERLFFDGALSGSETRNCASCHRPDLAFTDGKPTSPPLTTGTRLRNAPTLLNASLQRAQFADLRTMFLEDQVAAVVASPAEMHGTFPAIVARLSRDSAYVAAFARAFPEPRDSAISERTLQAALAAYVRSLTRLDSRVDLALRGDTGAISAEERRGFNLFAGKAACATCHFLPLTNGTVPPLFIETEHEVIGVPATKRWAHASVDSDLGRGGFTRAPLHNHAFKTPTVRNAAVTAPYMHNGVYATLDDVMRFYNVGGGAGIGIRLPNQTLAPDSLALTADELRALVSFMRALTDTSRTTVRR